MGAAVGNIIATIITTQIAMKSVARKPVVDEAIVMSMLTSPCCQTRTAHAAAASVMSKNNMALR